MKFLRNTKAVVIVCSLLIVAALATTGTVAWLVSNREAKSDGLTMEINDDSLRGMPITIYWKYMNDEKPVYTKMSAENGNIELPTYDSVFVEQNGDSRAYVKVPVFGDTVNQGDPFTITLYIENKDDTDGTDTIYSENKNLYEDPTAENKVVKLLLSNVIQVKCGMIPSLNTVAEGTDDATIAAEAQAVVTAAHTLFDATENVGYTTGRFLTVSTTDSVTTATKTTEIEFTVSNYNANRVVISDANTDHYILYLYFEISYDDALVEFAMEGRDLELGEQKVSVASDLDKFVLDLPSAAE